MHTRDAHRAVFLSSSVLFVTLLMLTLLPQAATGQSLRGEQNIYLPLVNNGEYISRILFTASYGGNYDIYVVAAAGGIPIRLTDDAQSDFTPVWSPNGRRILFASSRTGNFDIYVMDADGGNVIQLTNSPQDDWFPTWSPDGQQIAFVSGRHNSFDLFVMNTDGSEETRLTDGAMGEMEPQWSPNGDRIIFRRFSESQEFITEAEIYSINADGSALAPLTGMARDGLANKSNPIWSPDGHQIAFIHLEGFLGKYTTAIYTMNADGSNLRQLDISPTLPQSWINGIAWEPHGDGFALTIDGIFPATHGIYKWSQATGLVPLVEPEVGPQFLFPSWH